jgi:chromosome segregation ATPase
MSEPRTNHAPKIAANPNEVAGYRRAGGKPRGESTRGSGMGMNLLVAVLLVGLAAAGWFIVTQHLELTKAEATLAEADHRLAILEERSQATDQVMSQSGTEVQSKLGQWETEIRKLWDVAKQEKQSIAENEGKLKAQDGAINGIQTSLKDLNSSSARHEQALAQQTAIAQQLASIDQQVRQLVSQQRQLTDQVNAARQSISGLETGLTRRVVNNEKDIETINAYRLQLNSRLVELQTRIDALGGATTP